MPYSINGEDGMSQNFMKRRLVVVEVEGREQWAWVA